MMILKDLEARVVGDGLLKWVHQRVAQSAFTDARGQMRLVTSADEAMLWATLGIELLGGSTDLTPRYRTWQRHTVWPYPQTSGSRRRDPPLVGPLDVVVAQIEMEALAAYEAWIKRILALRGEVSG